MLVHTHRGHGKSLDLFIPLKQHVLLNLKQLFPHRLSTRKPQQPSCLLSSYLQSGTYNCISSHFYMGVGIWILIQYLFNQDFYPWNISLIFRVISRVKWITIWTVIPIRKTSNKFAIFSLIVTHKCIPSYNFSKKSFVSFI